MAGFDFQSAIDSQEDNGQNGPQTPFWALDFNDEEAVLKWLNAEIAYLKEASYERLINQRKNLASYRGIYLQSQDRRERDESADQNSTNNRKKNPRVGYNHMVDMVEQHVSRLTKYRGAISCTPGSDDPSDRVASQIGEKLITAFWQKDDVNIDHMMQKHVRRARISAVDYFFVGWNRNLGPYDRDWIRAVFKEGGIEGDLDEMNPSEVFDNIRKLKRGGGIPRLPLVDPETGEQMTSAGGDPLWIDRPVRMGDIEYKLIFMNDVFPQRKPDWESSEYCFWRDRMNIDTVKAQHPTKADKIEGDDHTSTWDADLSEEVSRKNEIDVWHLYHKSTSELDDGRYIKFVRSATLINKANPYIGDDCRAIIPITPMIDIETPGVQSGDSTVTHGRGPQAVYNNLISMDVRNKFLHSHPKWFMPKNAAKIESLANGTAVVSYRGPIAPKLEQPRIQTDMEGKTEAKNDMQQIMGVYGVSRGTPPVGVHAAVALTFLDEQEDERSNVGVAALTRSLLRIAKQTLWLMADNYDDDPERLDKLLGKNLAAQIKSFKIADLRSMGDIRIKNASALPQQKSAKLQYLIDIKKEFPGIMPDDQAVELLGLGEVERLQSIITVAIRAADSENEELMMGSAPREPKVFEYHLQHYRTHLRQMNEDSFDNLDEDAKQNFIDHVMAHEMFMFQIAGTNPPFGQLIAQEFAGFPYFYVPEPAPPPPMMPPEGGGLPGGLPPDMVPPPMMGEMPAVGEAQLQDQFPPGAEALGEAAPMGVPPGAETL